MNNTGNFDEYIGKEMLVDDMCKIFIDKWVIAEVTGKTPRLRSIGKAILYFDTEKEMHLDIRKRYEEGDNRTLSYFRGDYGPNTLKPRFERVTDYEEY